MKTYEIKFWHTEKSFYTAVVNAEDEYEAREIFEEDAFGYIIDEEPHSVDGLDLDIIDIKEV